MLKINLACEIYFSYLKSTKNLTKKFFVNFRANPVVWQCQFFTHGSKIDIETSFQFSLECPADVIRIEGKYIIHISLEFNEVNNDKILIYYFRC